MPWQVCASRKGIYRGFRRMATAAARIRIRITFFVAFIVISSQRYGMTFSNHQNQFLIWVSSQANTGMISCRDAWTDAKAAPVESRGIVFMVSTGPMG